VGIGGKVLKNAEKWAKNAQKRAKMAGNGANVASVEFLPSWGSALPGALTRHGVGGGETGSCRPTDTTSKMGEKWEKSGKVPKNAGKWREWAGKDKKRAKWAGNGQKVSEMGWKRAKRGGFGVDLADFLGGVLRMCTFVIPQGASSGGCGRFS
jgi:hypothetical protein